MALIPKVEPKQEKKVVSVRLDEETHLTLQRYATFLGDVTHEYIIGELWKRLFRRDKEFRAWLEKNCPSSSASAEAHQPANSPAKSATRPRVSPFLQRNRVSSSSLSVDCLPARSSSVLSVAGRRVAACIRSPISCWAIGLQIRKRNQAGSPLPPSPVVTRAAERLTHEPDHRPYLPPFAPSRFC